MLEFPSEAKVPPGWVTVNAPVVPALSAYAEKLGRSPVILGPNITGEFAIGKAGNYPDGSYGKKAFSVKAGGTYNAAPLASGNGTIVNFDASFSNSIYGNGSTVQPNSLVFNYIIKY